MNPYFNGVTVLAVDLVGTLVERARKAFTVRGLEHLARNGYDVPPARFRSVFRNRYREYSMGNYESDREFYSVLLADLSHRDWDPCFEELTDVLIECSLAFADAGPFLEQASAAYKLVLSTNHVSEWTERIIASNHWESYFHASVVSSDCQARKPSRRFFRELLKVSGAASPPQILFIGDSLVNDVCGATSSGLKAVLLDRKGSHREREFPGPVPTVSSLSDIVTNFLTGERAGEAKQFVAER